MGQDFSLEELPALATKEGLQNEDYLDQLLREIHERIKKDNPETSGHFMAYTRHRTRNGAPTVNRRSYNDEELKKFEVENDGFPLAATEDEIREFDMSFPTGKHRKQKKKQRSRSLTEVASLAGLRLPAISRPKFVDKLITGASSLAKKSSSFKDKNYKRQLSDQTTFYVESTVDSAADYVSEERYVHETSHRAVSDDGHVLFCSLCGLQIRAEDVKINNLESGSSDVQCSACKSVTVEQLCAEECSLLRSTGDAADIVNDRSESVENKSGSVDDWSQNVDDWSQNVDDWSQNVDDYSRSASNNLKEQECGTLSFVDGGSEYVNERSSLNELSFAALEGESSSEALEDLSVSLPEPDCQQNLSDNKQVETTEQPDEPEPKSQNSRQRPRPCGPSSAFIRGHVKRQCEAISRSLQTDQTHACFVKKVPLSKNDHPVTQSPSFVKHPHKGSLALQTEGHKRWQKNYFSPARDKKFPQAVMAKGYVKALADQINQQGALRHVADDESEEASGETSEMSVSSFSLPDCRDSEMHRSHTDMVAQEEELQPFKVNKSISSTQNPDDVVGDCEPSNSSHSSNLVPLNVHTEPGYFQTASEISQNTTTDQIMHVQENEDIKCLEQQGIFSSCSHPVQAFCNRFKTQSSKSSPGSSPKSSRAKATCTAHSPHHQTSQSFNRKKPAVDYASKPKVQKNSVKTNRSGMNNHKNSSLSSSATPSPSSSPSKMPKPPSPSAQQLSEALSLSGATDSTQFPFADQSSAQMAIASQVSIRKQHSSNSHNENTHGISNLHTGTDCNIYSPVKSANDSYNSHSGSDHDPTCSHYENDGVSLRTVSKRSSEQYRDSVFNTIYDNAPPLSAAELFDSSWSDSDSYNDFSDEEENLKNKSHKANSSSLSSKQRVEIKITDHSEAHLQSHRFRIVEELLQTERDYVARLHLLHHTFYFRLDNENRQQAFLPADTLKHMFSNTKSIFLFHHDFLLPQLEDRIKCWETDPRIGDLMKQNAPFLKMYTEYIRNFDRAMKLINQWMEKSAKFSEIIQDIQKLPECRSLSLQHHMLGPIQRVPRYELLLKDYVKHLPEGSPDFTDAKDALDLVTKAACHSNEAMKKIETFHKLLDIYQSLRGVPVDFISPTREFVTQGPVIKIAARSGERQLRQIFLFNDLVLICTQYNLLGTYSVRSLLEVESMEVRPGINIHIPNTFVLHSKQKVVELLDENPSGEAFLWQEKIQTVIAKYRERKRSIKPEEPREFASDVGVPESCLGKTAPLWIQDDAATMCMLCNLSFNVVRRRHHCRACGKLICKTCCKKAPLEYMNGKIDRVCVMCYNVIVNKHCMTSSSDSSMGKTSPKKKGILQVKASQPGLNSGYMHCSEDGGHTWNIFWITAHKDFVLYFFKAHEDTTATSSLPLPGHEVNQVWDIEGRPHVFCLSHKKKKVYMFQTDNEKRLKRWISVLEKLVQADLPEENSRLSSQSSSSQGSSASESGGNNNSNNRSSTHSGSQADSGYPGDSNNSLATLAVDQNDHENADGISQYDNVDGVVSE